MSADVPEAVAVNRRFWSSEAEAVAAVAEAMRISGNAAAATEARGGGALVTLGPGRYVNRAIGVGPELDDGDLDVIAEFFASHGLNASAQVSSWASNATLDRLSSRGYRPQWFRSVFAAALPLSDEAPQLHGIEIVEVDSRNLGEWLGALAEGNEIATAEARATSDEYGTAVHCAVGSVDLLAVVDGRAVGCGSVQIASGVGWLGGAATRPDARRRGVHSALLRHRIRLAVEAGCEFIAATALPPEASARNLLRHGLQLIDTQLVVTAETAPG